MQDPTKYPIGLQDFEKIRKEGYVYVDKTAQIRPIVDSGGYYFLSRPRRFGKSLLLSTLAAYFEGKKELFQGLSIAELIREWPKHPVLYLNLSNEKYTNPTILRDVLNYRLNIWEELYGKREDETTLSLRFAGIIKRAYEQQKNQVVILIDEYDKPLLDAVDDASLAEEFRTILQGMYSNLKSEDKYIRFVMLTGVARFGKVSVFSALNNLNDISMDHEYATLCGITEQEVDTYFAQGVAALAERYRISVEEARERLRRRYDGYLFEEDAERVYNPFSLLNTLAKKKFRDYWFATGTPSFLAAMMRHENFNLENLSTRAVAEIRFNALDTLKSNPLPILFQAGYLTIDRTDDNGNYFLRFPNEEVERSFLQVLLPYYASQSGVDGDSLIASMSDHVRAGAPEDFMLELQALLADTPYEKSRAGEIYFRNLLFIIFRLLGFYCEVEHPTAAGRSDVVIKTDKYIYVLELKVDQSAEAALRQIEEKGYAAPYAADKRKLFKLGVNFSGEKKQMDEWRIAEA